MGRDKLWLEWEGRPLLSALLARVGEPGDGPVAPQAGDELEGSLRSRYGWGAPWVAARHGQVLPALERHRRVDDLEHPRVEGGPLLGLASGLRAMLGDPGDSPADADGWVALVAGDEIEVDAERIRRRFEYAESLSRDTWAVLPLDPGGRPQFTSALLRLAAASQRVEAQLEAGIARLGALFLGEVPAGDVASGPGRVEGVVELAEDGQAGRDVDTPQDYAGARKAAPAARSEG